MKRTVPPFPCLCGSRRFSEIFAFDAAPRGQSPFASIPPRGCRRRILRCGACGHCVSTHDLDSKALYAGEYVTSTYGGNGIQHAYKRILSLPPERSDNVKRVERVLLYSRKHFDSPRPVGANRSVLDVGSGLCVFLHKMKKAGWRCTAIDPDIRAVKHARSTVRIRAIHGEFMAVRPAGRFDVVTFNKVLEHVRNPVRMLAKARSHLKPDGYVYVEVPDGESAAQEGAFREEFYIDHFHVFSGASVCVLAERSGFSTSTLGRIHEPSGKYTWYAFLTPAPSSSRQEVRRGRNRRR